MRPSGKICILIGSIVGGIVVGAAGIGCCEITRGTGTPGAAGTRSMSASAATKCAAAAGTMRSSGSIRLFSFHSVPQLKILPERTRKKNFHRETRAAVAAAPLTSYLVHADKLGTFRIKL